MTEKRFKLSDHFGTVYKTGNIYSIRFERLLNHPVEKVWNALTKPEQIALWLSSNHTEPQTEIDLKPGGKVRMQFMMGVSDGVISILVHNKIMEITWSKENISKWELSEEGKNKCRLVFTETLPLSFLPNATPAYHGYLDFLSLVLDGQKIPGNILEDWFEISKDASRNYEVMLNKL